MASVETTKKLRMFTDPYEGSGKRSDLDHSIFLAQHLSSLYSSPKNAMKVSAVEWPQDLAVWTHETVRYMRGNARSLYADKANWLQFSITSHVSRKIRVSMGLRNADEYLSFGFDAVLLGNIADYNSVTLNLELLELKVESSVQESGVRGAIADVPFEMFGHIAAGDVFLTPDMGVRHGGNRVHYKRAKPSDSPIFVSYEKFRNPSIKSERYVTTPELEITVYL